MLHILFVILKILGIVLLSLLALFLLLLLIVLLVPIRYQLDAKKRDEIIVKMRVNWLLRLVFLRIWYIDEQLHIKLRIFGIPIWDNLKPKKEKKVKKSKNRQSENNSLEEETQGFEGEDQVIEEEDQGVEGEAQGFAGDMRPSTGKSTSKEGVSLLEEKQSQLVIKTKQNEFSDTEGKTDQLEPYNTESQNSNKVDIGQQDSTIENTQLENSSNLDTKSESSVQDEFETLDEQLQKDDEFKHKQSKIRRLIAKITSFFKKIKNILQKIPKLFTNIKEKALQVKKLIRNLLDKKNKIVAFFQDETNKVGIKTTLAKVIALLRHCGPQKLKGYIKFGMEDPATTGQLLGVASIIYAKFQGAIIFEPDFENSVFEAEVMARGRIRIISLLIIGLRLILDKNFKELLKNVKLIKEELV